MALQISTNRGYAEPQSQKNRFTEEEISRIILKPDCLQLTYTPLRGNARLYYAEGGKNYGLHNNPLATLYSKMGDNPVNIYGEALYLTAEECPLP